MRHLTPLLPVLLSLGGLVACSETEVVDAEVVREVRTTFYPTTFFAERLLDGDVPVVCPLPPDEDPIFWSPSREDLAAFQRARLVVVNGAELEKWVARASLPRARVVDTAAGFADRFLTFEIATTHSHGPAGEHSHEGIDGHTWLDPLLAIEQVRALGSALGDAFPELAAQVTERRLVLEAELRALDERFRAELPPERLAGVRLFASHPAYQYLARRYGWSITNLDLDPEAATPANAIEALADPDGSARPIVLLWEGEPSKAAAGPFASVGVRNVVFSPVETAPDEGDFLAVLGANLDRLVEAVTRP